MELYYNINFDIAALILFFIHLVVHQLFPQPKSRRNTLYLEIILLGLISSTLDIATVFGYTLYDTIPPWLNNFFNAAFLASFDVVPCIYLMFVCDMVGRKQTHRIWRFGWILYTSEFLLITTSPWTKLIFYFDEDGTYSHGSLFYYIYVVTIIYLLIALILSIKHHKILRKFEKLVVISYTVGNLLVVIIQLFNPRLLISEFTVAVAVYFIYLTLQNPLEYMDSVTLLLNRDAFLDQTEEHIDAKKPFSVLTFELMGTDIIRERMGNKEENDILLDFATYLKQELADATAYTINTSFFALYLPADIDHAYQAYYNVKNYLSSAKEYQGVDLDLSVRSALFRYPENASTSEELLSLMEYWYSTGINDSPVMECTEEFIGQMHRENKLRNAIQRAIAHKSFEVYYQPIFNWRENRFTHAEALARLYDEELGNISPDEFITFAERTGQIASIGNIIYEKVCKLIITEHPENYGIRLIHVNLSALQCSQPHLAEEYIALMDAYHIPHHLIGFEVTETAATNEDKSIQENLLKFRNAGIGIAMDDYGTGYANLVNLARYSYQIVKIDKSLLWDAMSDIMTRALLENSIGMFKDFEQTTVIEGVENEEQIQMLKAFDADLFQGYYYSKPLPKDDFLSFIKEKNTED